MRVEKDQVITLGLILLLVGAFVGGMWYPRHARASKLREQNDQARAQVEKEKVDLAGIAVATTQVADLKQVIATSDRQVPNSADLSDLLRELGGKLNDHQVSEREIQTFNVVNGSDFNVIPVSMQFRATFPQAIALLREVEQSRRLVRVTTLNIDPPGRDRSAPLLVRMRLVTFSAGGMGSATEGGVR